MDDFICRLSDPTVSKLIAEELHKRLYGIDKLLIVCIGTPRSTGDSLAPTLGTKLESLCASYGIKLYGTIEKPVHALNIESYVKEIKELYPSYTTLAIDACATQNISNVGKLYLGNTAIKPGAGVGKTISPIGDITIKGIVSLASFEDLSNVDVDFILAMVYVLYSALENALDRLNTLRKVAVTKE